MVAVTVTPEEGRSDKEEVVEEINRFEKWFMAELKNGDPLTRHERAIVNDYLGWKLKTRG